jgi:hypothetical protein
MLGSERSISDTGYERDLSRIRGWLAWLTENEPLRTVVEPSRLVRGEGDWLGAHWLATALSEAPLTSDGAQLDTGAICKLIGSLLRQPMAD